MLRNGGLVTKVKSDDMEYLYEYDYKGNVTKITQNGSTIVTGSHSYSPESDTSTITEKGTTITSTDNKGDKTKTVTIRDNSSTSSTNSIVKEYDSKNRLSSIREEKNGENTVYYYSYDELDRVITRAKYYQNNHISTETFTYDNYGDLSNRVVANGNDTTTYRYTYTDDSERKLTQVRMVERSLIIKPKVDCLGRNVGKTIGNAIDDKITYLKHGDHATNIPASIRFKDGTYLSYKYDRMGNISAIYENGELSVEYEYDKVGRLVRENNKKYGETSIFKYDSRGNIIAFGNGRYSRQPENELENFYFSKFKYDTENRLVNSNYKFLADGRCTLYAGEPVEWSCKNVVSYGSNIFEYDAAGRRTRKNGITYTYDVTGKLISQSDDINFIYDHESLIGFEAAGGLYFYRKDILGNIIAILDTSGNVVVEYTYDAWGRCRASNTSIIGELNPYRYRGYYWDKETGLYFLKTRYYDPNCGRFISSDDVSYIDPETIGGTNLFAYCNNNPIMNIDPNGHFALLTFLVCVGIGAVAGAGATAVSDYKDDGKVFNGSVKPGEYVANTLLGAGVGAVFGLGTPAISAGLNSVGKSLAVDAISSLVMGSNQFGSVQGYAATFIVGGITKLGSTETNKHLRAAYKIFELIGAPIINQSYNAISNGTSFGKSDAVIGIMTNLAIEIIKQDYKNFVF